MLDSLHKNQPLKWKFRIVHEYCERGCFYRLKILWCFRSSAFAWGYFAKSQKSGNLSLISDLWYDCLDSLTTDSICKRSYICKMLVIVNVNLSMRQHGPVRTYRMHLAKDVRLGRYWSTLDTRKGIQKSIEMTIF